jgi:hypothetical protein
MWLGLRMVGEPPESIGSRLGGDDGDGSCHFFFSDPRQRGDSALAS